MPPHPTVTLYRHQTAFCPRCRRPVHATAPGQLRNCQIGPVTKATSVWLHHQLKLPFRQVRELLTSFFGMSVVPASALNFSYTATQRGEATYADLQAKIQSASLLHLDETSWRIDGKGAWLWYAGNLDLDFFVIDPSRSAAVIAEVLGDDFHGDIVSDGYAVYDTLNARWRQTCLAHIIRTAKDVATEIGLLPNPKDFQSDLTFLSSVAAFFSEVCHLDQQRRTGTLSRKRARAMVPRLRKRLKALATVTLTHPKAINLRDRLTQKNRDAHKLFTFLSRPGMAPTNNHAERALRGPVIARKISGGSRSHSGAHAFALIASLLGTARRQNTPLLHFLAVLFLGSSADINAALFSNSS